MSFDLIVYSKIKLHYEKNIKAFKDVGDKWRDVKISFDRYNGQFTAEGDFSRTFLNKQREGNTASSVDGFLYPIAALCHIACYKGLSSQANKKKFEDDLTAIMGGLNRLKATYAKEKIKEPTSAMLRMRYSLATCKLKFLNLIVVTIKEGTRRFVTRNSSGQWNLILRKTVLN